MALPTSLAGTELTTNPGTKAKTQPTPRPATPITTNSSQRPDRFSPNHSMDRRMTPQDNGSVNRQDKRCATSGTALLADRLPAEKGSRINPATTTDTPKP